GARGFRDQHADTGIAARQDKTFDNFEKGVLIVQLWLEIRGIDAQVAPCGRSDLDNRPAHFIERSENAARIAGLDHGAHVSWRPCDSYADEGCRPRRIRVLAEQNRDAGRTAKREPARAD